MSHVTTIDIDIHDLDALAIACEDCECDLTRGQKQYRWYGRHVGDYPLPQGFKAEDMGRCEHAITSRDKHGAYEVGVVERRDGQPGWTLIYDFYAGGQGMSEVVGDRCQKLKQAYAAEVTRKQMRKKGYAVKKSLNAKGEVVLACTRM
jgi:hypothetical protein